MAEPNWKDIQAQAQKDLEAVTTDQQAYAFIQKYLLRELQSDYLKLYQSDRREMNRTPRQALDNLLSPPPLE